MRIDIEHPNKLWAQRHHDHEIKNMGELNTRQRKQKEVLLLFYFGSMRDVIQGQLYMG